MAERGLLDLIISRIPGIHPLEKLRLCKVCNREADLILLSKKDIESILERKLSRYSWTMDELCAQAEADATAAASRGIGYVSFCEENYPPLLREIYDPPALLFYRGKLPAGNRPLVAVVGTRKPSGAAAAQAYRISRDFGREGVVVISGLALGIDALAHRGNLEGNAPTVAVLGAGLDGVYPASNRALARRILENGGALLGEYPPGMPARKWHFPARNRIIAGLARGVLVVEAPAVSGALITARFALEQGRDLWVAQAGVNSILGEGCRNLARDGAPVVGQAEDILRDWGIAVKGETRDTIPAGIRGAVWR
ncbi:MAG: DNA-processing protein DprA [Treponema sp.]|jgi:DNA processing protein|nr:DNA-processing protein DprA [Treponema sp.]